MTTSLPARKDVDPQLTWDLDALFANQADFNRAIETVKELASDFSRIYQHQLKEIPVIIDALRDYANIQAILDRIEHFAFLPQAADTNDPEASARLNQVMDLEAVIGGELSFLDSDLQQLPDDTLKAVSKQAPEFASFLRHILTAKAHALDPAVEKALTQLSPTLNRFTQIRDQTIFGDMDFGEFTAHGKTYPLSFVLYEEEYQKHPDTEIRRAAYAQFNKTLRRYQSTMAATYYAQVSKEKTLATMRGYDSVIDYLLEEQEVPRALFDRQIDLIMSDLAPIMRRYVTYIKEQRGLDHIGYTDLQIDLDPDFAPEVTLASAQQTVSDTVAYLGEDYQKLIMRAFPERWVDFAQNEGKDSGAFATKPYGVHPYIMMSWSDTLPSLYTLIHELGHTGQMTLSEADNSVLGDMPSTYIVESPSTFNELLLTHHLVETATDPEMKQFARSRLLSDTYFHNFVTHLLEAAFQREVYRLIDNGESFDAAKLNQIKRQVLTDFWGDAVELEEGAELTWMRQSHYYMGLYSYTYSAGLTIATQAYLRTLKEGQPAINDWLQYLALGDQLEPIAAAKIAGVDITTDQPLKNTIAFLGETLDQIIEKKD